MKYFRLLLASVLFLSVHLTAQVSNPEFRSKSVVVPDPNFHIYICFGQSNMEGNAAIAADDKIGVNNRFKVLTVAPDDFQHLGRSVGSWYTATPPLCRWDTGLTPADYFGRTMVDSLPDSVKVGVILIAMGGSGIDAFDKVNYTQYYTNADAWQKSLMNIYGGNPYAKIISMAKLAQQKGVIKGILLHQGETNNMQSDWPLKVAKIYNNMLADLNIVPNSIPLLAGEMLQQDQGGICWGMNSIIAKLPNYIPNSYAISSKGCTGNSVDGFHFSTVGARELGKRYGLQMLSVSKTYNTVEGQTVDHLAIDSTNFTLLTGTSKRIPLSAVFVDGHTLDIRFRATYEISNPEAVRITNGFVEAIKDGAATITASYKGALGQQKQVTLQVTSTSFPLTKELFNPSIYSTGTFSETTKVLRTGQYGFGGWTYSNGVNLSNYKYLVVKLASSTTSGASLRLFDENNYWGGAASYDFGSKKQINVDLTSMVRSGTTTKVDPSHLYIIGMWSNGGIDIAISDVYVTNNTDYSKLTALESISNTQMDVNEIVDVYSITGIRIRSQIERGKAMEGLPKGVYIVGNNNKFKKIASISK
jgi:hypothetical protein